MTAVKRLTACGSAALIACGLVLSSGAANAATTASDPQTGSQGNPDPVVTVVDAAAAGSDSEALRQQNNDPVLQIALRNVDEVTSSSTPTGVAFDSSISAGAATVPVEVTAGEPVDVIPQDNGTALVLPLDAASENHYGFIEAPVLRNDDGVELPARFAEDGGQ